MYTINKKKSGFIIKLSNEFSIDEALDFINNSVKLLDQIDEKFGAILIMNKVKPLSAHALGAFTFALKKYSEKGLKRIAVIQNNSEIKLQVAYACQQTEISNKERFINSKSENAVDLAIDWVKEGKEPIETSLKTYKTV